MIIDTKTLCKDEQVYLELQQLFENQGYTRFKMRKFEEYSLYLENKNFLGSEFVLTFNDPSGKLLALKPDVTLSIVKNAKATEKNEEKVYYRESVYRLSDSREFKEINQMGLEFIGNIDKSATLQMCELAEMSLAVIDEDFIFALSNMSFIEGLLANCQIESATLKEKVLSCIRSKNAHELSVIAEDNAISAKSIASLQAIATCPTDFEKALGIAEKLIANDDMATAYAELQDIFNAVKGTKNSDKIRLDFSIRGDIDYYNGIIFQGFVKGCPKMILSGGRYDRLLQKFNKNVGAMGFALSLSDIATFYKK